MQPARKKPADEPTPRTTSGRKLRFHAAHLPRPQPPHRLPRKDPPGNR